MPLCDAAVAARANSYKIRAYGVHLHRVHSYVMHSHEVHPYVIHSYEVHSYQMHAYDVAAAAHSLSYGMHTYGVLSYWMHSCRMYQRGIHSYGMHTMQRRHHARIHMGCIHIGYIHMGCIHMGCIHTMQRRQHARGLKRSESVYALICHTTHPYVICTQGVVPLRDVLGVSHLNASHMHASHGKTHCMHLDALYATLPIHVHGVQCPFEMLPRQCVGDIEW